jgi:hypothetical protein
MQCGGTPRQMPIKRQKKLVGWAYSPTVVTGDVVGFLCRLSIRQSVGEYTNIVRHICFNVSDSNQNRGRASHQAWACKIFGKLSACSSFGLIADK